MRIDPSLTQSLANGQDALKLRSGWDAGLTLGFVRRGSKTVLAERRHHGPLSVQRPFYADDGLCHVYLLHPPGGMVAGDSLTIDVALGDGSQALLTTPAAGKCYRSDGRSARQTVRLKAGQGSAVEWLPQESIVYNGARIALDTRIDLGESARMLAWDIQVFGRPAAGEVFRDGHAEVVWQIVKAGRPFHRERMLFDSAAIQAPWGLQGAAACGSLFALPADKAMLEAVRALIGEAPGRGVTMIDDLLICRALDQRADRLRAFLQAVWAALRPALLQRHGEPPRIWAY